MRNQHEQSSPDLVPIDPRGMASFLRASLPPALLEYLDMDSLTPQPGSFVDPDMRKRFTDLLYSVNLAGRRAFVYLLLDSQSSSDALTALFVSRFVSNILNDHVQKNPGTRVLPAVIPLVWHARAGGWNAATTLMRLYDLPSSRVAPGLLQALSRHLLGIEVITPPRELARRVQADMPAFGAHPVSVLMEFLMSSSELGLEELAEIINQSLGPDVHEAFMNSAEMIRKEGYDQGLEEGRRSVLLLLLEERFGAVPQAVEERVRAAGFEELDTWARALLRASTLDEVFAA
jgi:hypothetical protein